MSDHDTVRQLARVTKIVSTMMIVGGCLGPLGAVAALGLGRAGQALVLLIFGLCVALLGFWTRPAADALERAAGMPGDAVVPMMEAMRALLRVYNFHKVALVVVLAIGFLCLLAGGLPEPRPGRGNVPAPTRSRP